MTTPTTVAAGLAQAEPECKESRTGDHCWHVTGNHRLGNSGALEAQICCWCGAMQYVPEPVSDPAQHGKHLPVLWWMKG